MTTTRKPCPVCKVDIIEHNELKAEVKELEEEMQEIRITSVSVCERMPDGTLGTNILGLSDDFSSEWSTPYKERAEKAEAKVKDLLASDALPAAYMSGLHEGKKQAEAELKAWELLAGQRGEMLNKAEAKVRELERNKERERQHRRTAVNNYDIEIGKNIKLAGELYKAEAAVQIYLAALEQVGGPSCSLHRCGIIASEAIKGAK